MSSAPVAAVLRHVAASDCEAIASHLIAQPANTVSSLAYVAVGAVLWSRARRVDVGRRGRARAVAVALAAIGVGSVAFHGPGGPLAHWLHDGSIVAVALAALWLPVGARRPSFLVRNTPESGEKWTTNARRLVVAAGIGAGAALAVAPAAGNAVTAPALVAAVLAGARNRTGSARAAVAGVALLVGGFVLGSVSRTGQRLCDPGTLLQGHAAWHVLSAAALGLLAVALDGRPAPAPAPAKAVAAATTA